jgi:hypothetical protein
VIGSACRCTSLQIPFSSRKTLVAQRAIEAGLSLPPTFARKRSTSATHASRLPRCVATRSNPHNLTVTVARGGTLGRLADRLLASHERLEGVPERYVVAVGVQSHEGLNVLAAGRAQGSVTLINSLVEAPSAQ